ncbi:MAG: TIGR03560 family F420-dependent LLM class oxidoreductase [Candidatus Bathyarchaeota archaeon]
MPKEILFGIHAPPEGRNFEETKRICQAVEDAGFDIFTMTDHFMNMRNPNGANNHPLESWTALAALAAVTKKIKLATLVTCYAYRRPTVLAKMVTTVDIISGGRLIFGIGAGWHEDEFNGFIGRFPPAKERLQGLRETIEICKSMFTNERTTFNGKLYKVNNVLNSPQPIQKHISIMVGGSGEKVTLKIAAEYADISHLFATDLKSLEHKLTVLKKHCETVGRDYNKIRKATSMSLDSLETSSNIEKTVNNIEEYKNRGIGLITFRFSSLNDLRLFSKEIMPQF